MPEMPKINFRLSGFAMGVPVKTAIDALDADRKIISVEGMSSKDFVEKVKAGELDLCLSDLSDSFQTGENSGMVIKDVSAYASLDDLKGLEDKLDAELKTLGED
jgi:hypothetical protein